MTKFLNNADIKGYIAQTAVTSYLLKADSTGRLVAAIAGTDYQAPTTALLPSGGTAGQILAKIDGTNYNTQWIDNFAQQIKYDVKLGAALSKGTPVYVSSANGTNIIVSASSNATEATSSKTLGLLETGGALNDIVKVVSDGLLSGLNTSTATIGDPVWLGVNGALIFGLANKPSAPAHLVYIGAVTRVHAVNGEIFIKVQNGFELDELHNVALSSVADGQGLFYESATSLWKNKTIASVLGYTPANGANYLPLTGGTISGDLTISSTNSRIYFTDTDNNPDYFISNTDGTFTVYDVTNSVGRFKIYTTGNAELTNNLTAASFIKSGGTSAQFLKADGSVDSSTYLTSITSSQVTTALGYTPYNATNPSGYITSSALSSYLPLSGGTLTGALSGTSATFSGAVTTASPLTIQATNPYIQWKDANAVRLGYIQHATNLVMAADSGNIVFNTTLASATVSAAGLTTLQFNDTSGNRTSGINVLAIQAENSNAPYNGFGGAIVFNNRAYTSGIVASTRIRSQINNNSVDSSGGSLIFEVTPTVGGTLTSALSINYNSQLRLNAYTTSTSFSGTAAGYLAFDSSGNVITVAGVAATDNTKLPLAGGTMTGLLAFSNVTGNKIDFYHTTTGSGDRYGVQVQNSELRIHSGAGGDAAGGITFGKSTTTTFTEAMRVRNDGNVLLANAGTLILGIDDTMDRTVVGGASRTRLQLAPPSHTGAEWTFVTYDDSSNAYIRIGYGNGSSSFQMRHDGYTTIAGNVLLHAGNYSSYALPLSGGVMTGSLVNNTDGAVLMESNASENNNWLWKENAKSWGLFWFNRGSQSGQTIGSYTTIGAELMFMGGGSGIAMPTGWTGYQSGSNIAAMISNYTGYIYSASTIYAASEMRTSVFRFNNSSNNAYLTGNSDWGFRVVNDSGYIQFGPANPSWAHIYSGLPFYFNQNLFVNGTQVVTNSGTWGINISGNAATATSVGGYTSDGWLRKVSDSTQFQMYGNTRTMIYRTDGVTNPHGGGGYAHIFYYGGSGDGNRVFIINTDGRLYSPYHGWLDTMSVSYASSAGSAAYIPTRYDGIVSSNPQQYFSQGTGVKVAMTGAWSVWSDTLWINGYSGGDVLQMCALHTLRNGTPRMAISVQASNSTSYGTFYEFLTGYNYTSFSPSLTGAGASGTWGISISGNAASASAVAWSNVSSKPAGWLDTTNLIIDNVPGSTVGYIPSGFYQNYAGDGNPTGTWFNYINVRHSNPGNNHGFQIGMSYYDNNLWFRSYQGGGSAQAWARALSTQNYNSYSPTLTGGGASGTWGINITGNANNITQYTVNQSVGSGDSPTHQTIYLNDWVRTRYESGIYFESYSAGLRSAYQASFGQVATYGTARSGHGGYIIVNNYVTNLMQDTSGNFGFFSNDDWAWRLFYNRGNNCWGIGTDNTYSGDGFRVIKYGSAQYGWTTWSDRRAKENISSITGALDKVLGMRGVYYNYIKDEAKSQHVGFIAQELIDILPQSVRYAEEIDEYNINYGPIVSVLAEAIKEQNIEIQSLKAQIETLLN